MKFLQVLVFAMLITACGVSNKNIKVQTPGYKGSVDVYETKDNKTTKSDFAFILLHPKHSSKKDHGGVTSLAGSLSSAGYTVYTPDMPYSPYTATLTDGFKLIDKLVEKASKGGKKVILTGHSMGGAVAYLYGSAYKPHKNLAGIVVMAPGHMLQVSMKIQEATAISVQKARKMVKKGNGSQVATFHDYNQGNKSTIEARADVYLSYFDPWVFPNPATNLDTQKVPVLWIDGDSDIGAMRMGYVHLFDRMNKYTKFPQNQYHLITADHYSVPYDSDEIILKWLKTF